jgi:hypothetical protein
MIQEIMLVDAMDVCQSGFDWFSCGIQNDNLMFLKHPECLHGRLTKGDVRIIFI